MGVFWQGVILGVFAGVFLGACGTALLMRTSRADRDIQRAYHEWLMKGCDR